MLTEPKNEEGVIVISGLMTLPMAAKELGVSRQNAYKMAKKGRFETLYVIEGTDLTFVRVYEVEELRQAREARLAAKAEKDS